MVSVKVAYNMEIAKKGGNFGYPRSDRAQLWPRERLTATFTSEDTFMIFTATVDLFGAHKNNITHHHMVKILLQTMNKFSKYI